MLERIKDYICSSISLWKLIRADNWEKPFESYFICLPLIGLALGVSLNLSFFFCENLLLGSSFKSYFLALVLCIFVYHLFENFRHFRNIKVFLENFVCESVLEEKIKLYHYIASALFIIVQAFAFGLIFREQDGWFLLMIPFLSYLSLTNFYSLNEGVSVNMALTWVILGGVFFVLNKVSLVFFLVVWFAQKYIYSRLQGRLDQTKLISVVNTITTITLFLLVIIIYG